MNFVPSTPDKQIVIIPDSVLFNLPFAALIDENGKYFVENHLLSLSTSMGAILDGETPIASGLSVLVAANGSADEQTESSNILNAIDPSPCSTLSTQSANLEELQRVSQDKQILHVSSAIPMTDDNPARTKLPFAPGEVTKDSTAVGLFQLSIPNDLVVLSGTSITGSDQTGKAVQVFGRGLRYAGAKNVMMSLWNEPSDTRTAEIGNFYKSKKAGLSSAQSLRKAQLLALSADRNPKAWAAFQLLGAGM
jgi:CHAT domain-containing protein